MSNNIINYAECSDEFYPTPLLPSLSIRALAVLEKDISSADGYGDEKIDRPDWMKFLTAVRAELARKRAKL